MEMSDQSETVMLSFSPWEVLLLHSKVGWLQVLALACLVPEGMSTLAMESSVLEVLGLEVLV